MLTARPVIRESVSLPKTGVSRATSAMRARAASMSVSCGAVVLVNVEHLLHDLANRRERVELTALDLVEQPAQLLVVLNRTHQMRLCPGRRDGEHLAGQVAPSPRLELAGLLEGRAVLGEPV